MWRKTKIPTTGRLLTLGNVALGQFAGEIIAFEQVLGKSRHHFASFSDSNVDGVKGGARFTASACKMVAGLIIGNIETGGQSLPVQWPDLSSDYEKAKEKYAPDKSQWRLTDHIIQHIGVQKRRGEAGRSVGIYGRDRVPKINFAAMRWGRPAKTIWPSKYAYWNEFGTGPTKYSGGQPPRPVFIPTFQQFVHKYLPGLADAISDSLEEDFERLKKNLDKPSGKFVGEGFAGKLSEGRSRGITGEFREDAVLGATYFKSAKGGDAYQKKLKKDMASSGAEAWLAKHAAELGGFED